MKKILSTLLFVFCALMGFTFAVVYDDLEYLNKSENSFQDRSTTTYKKGNTSAKFIESSKGNYISIKNGKKISKFVMPYYHIDYADNGKKQESFLGFENLSPSGTYISFNAGGYEANIFYVLNTKTTKITWKHYGYCNSLWSKDKQQIIIGCKEGMGRDSGLYINKKGDFPNIKKVNGDSIVGLYEGDNDKLSYRSEYYGEGNSRSTKDYSYKIDLSKISFEK